MILGGYLIGTLRASHAKKKKKMVSKARRTEQAWNPNKGKGQSSRVRGNEKRES
jgi:hypothetical protein